MLDSASPRPAVASARALAARLDAPRLVALLAVGVGVLDLLAVMRPGVVHRVAPLVSVLPGVGVAVPGISVALGVLLPGLARGLARGKHGAWQVALALVAVQAVLQVGQRHALAASASAVVAGALVATRHQFAGRTDRGTVRRSLAVGAALLGVSLAIGAAGLALLARAEHAPTAPGPLAVATLQGLAGIPSTLTWPDGHEQDLVYYLLLSLGIVTVGVTGALVLRSVRPLPGRSALDESALRASLTAYGDDDSLGYFALREDRSLVWSPDGRAAVSYRVVAGTALAAGDPLGSRAQWPDAIAAFVALARASSWLPAVAAASSQGAEAWLRWGGLTAIELGDEAVLRPETFTLEGREMRNVRQAVARARRSGLEVSVDRLADLDSREVDELRSCSHHWRPGPVERGFSMGLGRIDASLDPCSVAVRAHQDGRLRALLVLVPWGSRGLSLDLMRRDPRAESGVTELMVVDLMRACADLRVEQVSLNFAVFRDAIERAGRLGAGPATRAWGSLLRGVARWSQADSLYRFNAKFRPEWHPRFLLYPGAAGLPRVAVAYLDAESLVRLPRLRRAA